MRLTNTQRERSHPSSPSESYTFDPPQGHASPPRARIKHPADPFSRPRYRRIRRRDECRDRTPPHARREGKEGERRRRGGERKGREKEREERVIDDARARTRTPAGNLSPVSSIKLKTRLNISSRTWLCISNSSPLSFSFSLPFFFFFFSFLPVPSFDSSNVNDITNIRGKTSILGALARERETSSKKRRKKRQRELLSAMNF